MATTSRTIVRMPGAASRGEIVEITAIAQHDMESGFRSTERGERIPRDIIREFVCTYNGVDVFRAQLHPLRPSQRKAANSSSPGRATTITSPKPGCR